MVITDPALLHVYYLKDDARDVFYCISLQPRDVRNLGLFLHLVDNGDDLVAIPITLPILNNNSPSIFCTAMETVVDLENAALH